MWHFKFEFIRIYNIDDGEGIVHGYRGIAIVVTTRNRFKCSKKQEKCLKKLRFNALITEYFF